MNENALLLGAVFSLVLCLGTSWITRFMPDGSFIRFLSEKIISPSFGIAMLVLTLLWFLQVFF